MLLSSRATATSARRTSPALRCHRARRTWRTEPDDDLGDDYARHALTGEADAFHTPSPIGGDLG